MQAQVQELASELDSPRLLTLTLRSSDDPLDAQVKRIRACFRRLRQRKAWRRHVQGGLMVIEITYNSRRDQWHPHIHCLIDASYWKQADLADLWEEITQDSRIIDIRVAHSTTQAVKYLAKYVSKTSTPPSLPLKRIGEWAEAVTSLRYMQTFGSLHGRARRDDNPPDRQPLERIMPLEPLFEAAHSGDPTARQLVEDLKGLRADDDGEQHHRVYTMLTWWWETWNAEHSGTSASPCPSVNPPTSRQGRLYDDDHPPPSALII